MMTYQMAFLFPCLFRAIAPVAGGCINLPLSNSNPPSSVSKNSNPNVGNNNNNDSFVCTLPLCPKEKLSTPTLHIHSVDDPRALYHGGWGPVFPGTNNRMLHPPVEE